MNDTDLCDTDPAMRVFSGFLIALHELGRLNGNELAEWQAGVERALKADVAATEPSRLLRTTRRRCVAELDT